MSFTINNSFIQLSKNHCVDQQINTLKLSAIISKNTNSRYFNLLNLRMMFRDLLNEFCMQ